MTATKQEQRQELAKLQKQVDKLSGKKQKQAKRRIAHLKYVLAGKQNSKKVTKKSTKRKARIQRTKQVFNEAQGFLPNFLDQLDVKKLNEMIAQRVFDAMAKELKSIEERVTVTEEKRKKAQ